MADQWKTKLHVLSEQQPDAAKLRRLVEAGRHPLPIAPETRAVWSRVFAGAVALAVFLAVVVLAWVSLRGPAPQTSGGSPTPPSVGPLIFQERPVVEIVPPGDPRYHQIKLSCRPGSCSAGDLANTARVILEDDRGDRVILGPILFDQSDIAQADPHPGPSPASADDWTVDLRLDAHGTQRLAFATRAALSFDPPQDQIAVIVDGRLVSAPAVHAVITSGAVQVSNLTQAEAQSFHPAS